MTLQNLPLASEDGNFTVGAAAVQRELWVSFTSLLRSYAAALWQGFPGSHFEADLRESDGLALRLGSNSLDVVYRQENGTGTWAVNGLSHGVFCFTEDGRVSLGQSAAMEMDAAAEVLAGKLI